MPRRGGRDQRRRPDLRRARGRVGGRCWKRGWSDGQPHVVLDLQGVAVIDSAGLELLLDAQEKCQRMGGALKLANPGALVPRSVEGDGRRRAV